jgi:transposase-like protein
MESDEKKAVWRARIQEWEQSGMTAREFARRHGFHENTLSSWKRKLVASGSMTPVGLIHLAGNASEAAIEVVSARGFSVRVRRGVDVELLRAVLHALES